jgi:type II secretory pathway pseudopilin PulG
MKTLMRNASRLKAARTRAVDSTDVDPEAKPDDHGVSGIIELVIVLVILGVLTAILLPTFLGTTSQAKDRSAQSDLSNGVTAAASYYAGNASFPATLNAELNISEPELHFLYWSANPNPAPQHNVVVFVPAADNAVLCVASPSGTFYLGSINESSSQGWDGAPPGVEYKAVASNPVGTCTGNVQEGGWQPGMPS